MHASQFANALYLPERHGWTRFVSMQNHANLLYREEEREMFGLCREEGVGIIPWSPLARGKLTRPWEETPSTKRGDTDQFGKTLYKGSEASDRAIVDAVGSIAERLGAKRATVALAWLLGKPGVSAPIIGASKPHHLEDAVAALSLKLSDEDVAALEAPYQPRAVAGFA